MRVQRVLAPIITLALVASVAFAIYVSFGRQRAQDATYSLVYTPMAVASWKPIADIRVGGTVRRLHHDRHGEIAARHGLRSAISRIRDRARRRSRSQHGAALPETDRLYQTRFRAPRRKNSQTSTICGPPIPLTHASSGARPACTSPIASSTSSKRSSAASVPQPQRRRRSRNS